jgi:DNA-binding NarL/FixJ family response regulator
MNAGFPARARLHIGVGQHSISSESHATKTMPNSKKTSVLIADAEPVARCGMVRLIESHAELHVVGEADGLPGARDLCTRLKPQIVIVDPAMADGFAFIRDVRRWSARAQVVAFTVLEDIPSVQRAYRAGVCGYVSRLDSVESLMEVLLAAARGEKRVGARVRRVLMDWFANSRPEDDEHNGFCNRPVGEEHGSTLDTDLSRRAALFPDEEYGAD